MKYFSIEEKTLVSVLTYLKKQPYNEVDGTIRALEEDIKASLRLEEESKEKEEQSN